MYTFTINTTAHIFTHFSLSFRILPGRSSKTTALNSLLNDLETDDQPTSTNIFITPPDEGKETGEDSGDEENVTVNNLTGKQLTAEAEFQGNDVDVYESCTSEDEPKVKKIVDHGKLLRSKCKEKCQKIFKSNFLKEIIKMKMFLNGNIKKMVSG